MKKADILRALALLTLIAAAVAGLIVLSVNEPLREALGESLGRFRGSVWGPGRLCRRLRPRLPGPPGLAHHPRRRLPLWGRRRHGRRLPEQRHRRLPRLLAGAHPGPRPGREA